MTCPGKSAAQAQEQAPGVHSVQSEDFMNNQELTKAFIDRLNAMKAITADQIPNIDLYMDQVTTFMDTYLSDHRRYETDKVLTKTMINNYAKNDLLPPPTKKKYSREHMLVLTFIYYFKNLLSITDIQALLKPLTDKYFKKGGDFGIEDIYKEVFSLEKDELAKLRKDIEEKSAISKETFKDAPEEDRDFLQLFSFICLLAFDTYMKKTLIEKLIDSLDS